MGFKKVNDLQQPTTEEIEEILCSQCNALTCTGCVVQTLVFVGKIAKPDYVEIQHQSEYDRDHK